ncbi:putative peptidoglycan binding protein [Haloactinospora alba]|uniref:Putative peptidoglycan binding protein n=1 Tax=Haloactinospora alba TaxID=405555 RepID=A0A543N2M5_9ACTN|nr:N-acetylmuramoyl-L-alanine amidase [Haloactinospora alba]TQN26084.1 putative peptidoglycan binding protein [Haloactinospora alba]
MPEPSKLVWRSDLGWPSESPASDANPKQGLVIHYDSADQNLANKSHSACIDYWNSTRDYHVNGNGWADIAYSFFACPHGYVIEGRGLFKTQAAQLGHNSEYYSCTLSGGPTDPIPDAQIDAVRELRAWLMEPDTSISGTVIGHRDLNSTSCPGDTAYALVQDGLFATTPGDSIPDDSDQEENTDATDAPDWPGTYLSQPPVEHSAACETWQDRMRERGWVDSDGRELTVDGWYGPESERVCRLFQSQKGLSIDGIVGPETWDAAWTEPLT